MKNISVQFGSKKATVFVYTILLVFVSMIFASVILSENEFLYNTSKYFKNDYNLYSNIKNDSDILIKINENLNSNWSGFVDNISCPDLTSVTMSWIINTANIWTQIVNSWSIYCSWTYLWNNLKLYFNTWFTDIVSANFSGSTISITSWVWDTAFSDTDSTQIDFSSYNLSTIDLYDDDFNSDNYMITSTWNTSSWTYYPNSFQDDDIDWRKKIIWFVSENDWYKKIFWNSLKYKEIINNNTNNNDNLNIKIWEVTDWYLYLDIDSAAEIKLVEFDNNKFKNYFTLEPIKVYNDTLLTSSWYLQNNSWSLSLTGTITWDEFNFDFKNWNYVLFLKKSNSWSLVYNIIWVTSSGTWIYITPINDSYSDFIEYLWNEIIIDSEWSFVSEEKKIIFTK